MEPTNKQETPQNNYGRELFISTGTDESIPERMMDIEEKEPEENSSQKLPEEE